MNQNKKGMTLVELIVSIALLSIVMVFLTKLLVSVSANSLSVITRGEYREAVTILTKNIQDELLQEDVDFLYQCDTTNTCIKIGFNSGNLLTIRISSDNKAVEIVKTASDGSELTYLKKQTPMKDGETYIGKYDDIEYSSNKLSNVSSNYDYEYNALLSIKFNIYDKQNNEYPIEISYPYNEDETNIMRLSTSEEASLAWPIGSIYQSTTISTVSAVQAILGGTWESYGSGRVLVGVDTTQTEFDTVGETGGEKTQILRAWIGAQNGNATSIGYWYDNWAFNPAQAAPAAIMYLVIGSSSASSYTILNHNTIVTQRSGANATTIQPYITVYTYRRTA